jgi:nucleotide-binding universal stress UspA family protein
MKTIIALVDFSDVSAQVVEQGGKLAKAFGARLIILHGVPKRPEVMDLGVESALIPAAPIPDRVEADYTALLDLQDSVLSSGVTVSVHQVDDATANMILERCKALGADVVVVGANHRSKLYELFVGSFTSEVLRGSTCPVLVVPAHSPRA